MGGEKNHPVNAVQKSLKIVETLAGAKLSVSELADVLGMNTSTVYNHLKTLEEEGYVIQQGEEYELTFSFLHIGGYHRYHYKLFRESQSSIDELADQTGEVASLLVEQNGKGAYLYIQHGEQSLEYDNYVGKQTYLHSSAHGKCILAHLSENRVLEIIDHHGLPKETKHTITNEKDLFNELADVRERGFAWDKEEGGLGVCCVAAPILTDNETVLGGISITGPVSRMQGDRFEDDLPKLVCDTANVIELNMRYSDF